ncbi:MAG TPA: hypothetical protein VG944_05985 [Fimbriimonas sp.]|nr:hypothetical protein [Fimbriimonas sp.]
MIEVILTILFRIFTLTFSPTPAIKKEGGLLAIESTWKTALLTLGGRHRRVLVDPKNRGIILTDRRFWLFRSSRRIPFDAIVSILYGYVDLADSWFSHYDEDLYTVGLNLTNGTSVAFFRFFGQGSFTNNSIYPDWCFWEENMVSKTAQHDMESESATLAGVLSHITGAPLEN